MRNRKHRYNQRSFKYQDQQRVPAEEIYDDDDTPVDDDYSDNDSYGGYYSDDCGFCAAKRWEHWITKEGCTEDWVSDVDSGPDEDNYIDQLKMKSVEDDKQRRLQIISLNRYALLDDQETDTSSSLDTVEDNKQGRPPQLNKMEEEEEDDESEWNIYYRKSVRKQINKTKLKTAALLVYVSNPAIHKWIDSSWCNDHGRQQAIASLSSADGDDDILIIHTDGCFRKNRKTAGYGVIIRTSSGVPLVGSSGVGKPVSALYHELQGINRGLELAIKYGICNNVVVMVYCSSYLAADLLESRSACICKDRDYNSALRIVCKACMERRIPDHCSEEEVLERLMYPLIQEIMDNSSMFTVNVYAVKRTQNRAADCLAKVRLQKEEIEPHEFSDELKAILYDDAQGGELMPTVWRERLWWVNRGRYY